MTKYVLMGAAENNLWEEIDEFDNEDEARRTKLEYEMAFGKGWVFYIKKIFESK